MMKNTVGIFLSTLVIFHGASQCVPQAVPPKLVSAIIETSSEEHCATLKDVIDCLRIMQTESENSVRSPKTKKSEAHLIGKQIARFEKICTSLWGPTWGSAQPTAKPNRRLSLYMSTMLQEERTLYAQKNKKRIKMAEDLWMKFENLVQTDLDQKVSVQQSFLIDLALNMVIISGESYAQQLFSQEDQAEESVLTGKIKTAQEAFQAQQKAITSQTQTLIGNLSQNFTNQLSTVKQDQGAAQTRFVQEMNYINQLITATKDTSEFVINQIPLDLAFGASKMHTPNNGSTWHNVYQRADWEFDSHFQGFVQRVAPGSQPAYIRAALCSQWQGSSTSTSAPTCTATPSSTPVPVSSNQGALNYIFTEYYTAQSAYQIQVQITLVNCVFPFCAGVMFNVARWISGAPDRMNTHRLAALYGSKDSQGNLTVSLYGGQTTLSNSQGISVPVTPLNEIIGDVTSPQSQTELLYTLSSQDIQGLSQEPLTFTITISNSESNVTIELDKNNGTTSQNLFGPSGLSKLNESQNQLMFWYHGIGFISPGCQAVYKVIQPTALAFTQSQITAFKQPKTAAVKEAKTS